jgi:hypothetical protein
VKIALRDFSNAYKFEMVLRCLEEIVEVSSRS